MGAIYQPKGKANEYSPWAVNFYKGCNANCSYCYMKKGVLGTTWTPYPVLKACFRYEDHAFEIFQRELHKNLPELKKHGLLFNFSSDPFLQKTIDLNMKCLDYCADNGVPTRTLTKQAWYDGSELFEKKILKNNAFGFTLTGMDNEEPGACLNIDRIWLMNRLYVSGCKIWASIEPIIDLNQSELMISKTKNCCHHFKIGLLSGKCKYTAEELRAFMNRVNFQLSFSNQKKVPTVYWKESFLKVAEVTREDLPENCVDRRFVF